MKMNSCPQFPLSTAVILALWVGTGSADNGEVGVCVDRPDYEICEVGPGPEDFVIDSRTNPALPRLIFSSVRRPYGKRCGALLSVPLLESGLGDVVSLKIDGGEALAAQPVGLSLLGESRDSLRLFVTAKPCRDSPKSAVSEVRRYRVQGDELVLEAKFQHPDLMAPNGIVAISANEFLVSNFPQGGKVLHYRRGWWRDLEKEFEDSEDGLDFKLEQDLEGSNGLAFDKNRNLLYVADFDRKLVRRLSLSKGVGELCPINLKDRGHPDNLSWDAQGRLIVATHRSKIRSFLHLMLGWSAPWDVWGIDPSDPCGETEHLMKRETLLRSDRAKINAVSTAAFFEDRLIISQLRQPSVLVLRR